MSASHAESGNGQGRILRREPTVDPKLLESMVVANQQRQLNARCFAEGSVLSTLAEEHMADLSKLLQGKRCPVPQRAITIGAACTGSFVEAAIARCFEDAASGQGYDDFAVKLLFSCDPREGVREWGRRVHEVFAPASGRGETHKPCMFHDAFDLNKSVAYCSTHKRNCKVPSCCVFVCRVECADFNHPTWSRAFMAMLRYLEAFRPSIIILENCPSTAFQNDVRNTDLALSELASRGYECQQMRGDASLYGTPEKRWAECIIGVLVVANPYFVYTDRSVSDTFITIRSLIKVCQRFAPCASAVLHSPSSSRLASALSALKARKPDVGLWNQTVAINRAISRGVTWSLIHIPENIKSSPWFSAFSNCQMKMAAYSLHINAQEVLLRDVSRGKTRFSEFTGGYHRSFAMQRDQVVLVFKGDEAPRILLDEEAMILQGFPVARVYDLVDATPAYVMKHVAGGMMSGPLLLVLLMATVASVPWHTEESSACSEPQSQDDAVALFALGLLTAANGGKEAQPAESPPPNKNQVVNVGLWPWYERKKNAGLWPWCERKKKRKPIDSDRC